MSLYLCVFDEDEELDGVDAGAYSDFGDLRNTIAKELERRKIGSCFPTLMLHSDCDGEFSVDDCEKLQKELEAISAEFKKRPPKTFFAEWQVNVAKKCGLRPQSLYDCFIDVDGEPLLERLLGLARLAQRRKLPVLFQ
jgi:hypothetical protein